MSETSSAMAARYAMNRGFKSVPSYVLAADVEGRAADRPALPRPPRTVATVVNAGGVVKRRGELLIARRSLYFQLGGGLNPGTPASGATTGMPRPGAALAAGPGTVERGIAVAAGAAVETTVGPTGWSELGAADVFTAVAIGAGFSSGT
jgi:hypothetical protein